MKRSVATLTILLGLIGILGGCAEQTAEPTVETEAAETVMVTEEPKIKLPIQVVDESPSTEEIPEGAIMPYTITTNALLEMLPLDPMLAGTNLSDEELYPYKYGDEFDGYYEGNLECADDPYLKVSVFEPVFYHKEDIENIKAEDVIVIDGKPLTVSLIGERGETFAEGATKGLVWLTFNEETLFGARTLYMKYYQGIVGDYCITPDNLPTLSTHTKTMMIPVENQVWLEDSAGNGKMVSRDELYKSITDNPKKYQDKKTQVYVENSSITKVIMYNSHGFTLEKEVIEQPLVEGALNPYSLMTLEELTNEAKLEGFNGNYNATIEYLSSTTLKVNLYRTDLYDKNEFEKLSIGDNIVINGKNIEIAKMDEDDMYNLVLISPDGERYAFAKDKSGYTKQPDYYQVYRDGDYQRPRLTLHETRELKVVPGIKNYCIIARNGDDKKVSFEEMMDFIKDNPNLCNEYTTTVFLMDGVVGAITLNIYDN